MQKVYFSRNKAKIVFSVRYGDNKVKNVQFSNFGGSYSTSDVEEQKAVEDTFYFKNGLIYTLTEPENEEPASVLSDDSIEDVAEDITDIQSAKKYLQTKYNISHQSLRSPDAILKQAELNKISFPNLKG
jgi:hypothetical protein